MLSGFQPVHFIRPPQDSVSNSKCGFHQFSSYLTNNLNYSDNYKSNKFLFSSDGNNFDNGVDSHNNSFNNERRSFHSALSKRTETTNTEPGFVVALSIFLAQIATSNSSSTCDVGSLTPFHSVCVPPIPIRAYLMRIAQHFCCSNECFVLAIVYVGRIIKLNRGFSLTLLNVHRVILTAIMLATKFFDDVYFSNAFYANISGVGARELNSLEIYFLRLIKFQLFVTETEYELHKNLIIESATNSFVPPSLPMNIMNIQMNEKSNEFQMGEFQYFDGRCMCRNSRDSCSHDLGAYFSHNYIENQDLRSEHITHSSNLREFNGNIHKSGHRNNEMVSFPNLSINSNIYASKSCTRFTTDMDVNSTRSSQQGRSLSNSTLGKLSDQEFFLYRTERYENPNTDYGVGNRYSFIGRKTLLNQRLSFDNQTDCSTASQSEFDEVEQFPGRIKKQFSSGTNCSVSFGINNSSYRVSDNSSGIDLQHNSNSQFQAYSYKEHSNSFPDNQFPVNKGSASDIRTVCQNGYGNTSKLQLFPAHNSSNSVQTSVSAFNPAVSHYGKLIINSYNFSCATGLDKKLFV
ncbi:cyclin [Cryptosporidium xiaoi]|uniref:Cyclin n=1 Tax=Cryptosporidium xiaoi TaxID=659607 RepID=A0AAV9Y193_9CRYT